MLLDLAVEIPQVTAVSPATKYLGSLKVLVAVSYGIFPMLSEQLC